LQWADYFKLRRIENGLSRKYEIAVCSQLDKEFVGGGRVWVIPNGIDVPPVPEPSSCPEAPNLVFIGLMSYAANADGISYFVQKIFPLIRRKVPAARFWIVGRDPTESVRALHDGSHVIVTGEVPCVKSYLRNATCVVVPLRFGGGTRIKILEAMAHRKPVVSTSVGAEGIDIQAGEHYLRGDDPVTFADACVSLLCAPALADQLASAAYQRVVERYQWSSIEDLVRDIVGAGARAGASTSTSSV
jgi:glycosyltransferase involved in cell wall biosynthesis